MTWPDHDIGPVEHNVFKSDQARVGVFDCPETHPCFPVTESVRNNLFVLATKPVWIRRNTRDFQYVGPGGVLLHPAGVTIERRSEPRAHDLSYWFAIQPGIYDEIINSHCLKNSLPTEAMCPTPAIQLQLRVLLSQVKMGEPAALDIEANVISLLDEICVAADASRSHVGRVATKPETRRRARRLADSVKWFIDANLTERLDIHSVATEVGASPYHLCRLFKLFNGITIHEYRIRQRLALVMQRLMDGTRNDLTELALEAGFSSHSHLTRLFKSRLGAAPSIVRLPAAV